MSPCTVPVFVLDTSSIAFVIIKQVLEHEKPLYPPHRICGGRGVFMPPSDVETLVYWLKYLHTNLSG
ncbi:hypothetical protein K492DRAFT_194385 [Lichtheimia hyalospora FSU 10163]|nr:hypothetical protein K492DRAFT_194385 [Lichtheimia hyalospora FSU 10163]